MENKAGQERECRHFLVPDSALSIIGEQNGVLDRPGRVEGAPA